MTSDRLDGRSDWSAEWIYELAPAETRRLGVTSDRGLWFGKAESADDAKRQIQRYVERCCGAGGTLQIGGLRRNERAGPGSPV